MDLTSVTPTRPDPEMAHRVDAARKAAIALEASFLSEMFKAAGFGEQTNSFSGDAGEDQFASFHRDAMARKIAEAGGVGLAEHFFRAMTETEHGT